MNNGLIEGMKERIGEMKERDGSWVFDRLCFTVSPSFFNFLLLVISYLYFHGCFVFFLLIFDKRKSILAFGLR